MWTLERVRVGQSQVAGVRERLKERHNLLLNDLRPSEIRGSKDSVRREEVVERKNIFGWG